MENDFYDILGIERECELYSIKQAFKDLAVKWHPDKNPDRLVNDFCYCMFQIKRKY